MQSPHYAVLTPSEARSILQLIGRTQITGGEALTVVKIQARLQEVLSWHDANKQQVALEQQLFARDDEMQRNKSG